MSTSLSIAIADIYAGAVLTESLASGDVRQALQASQEFGDIAMQIRRSADLRAHLVDVSLPLAVRQGLLLSLFPGLPDDYQAVFRMLVERQELKLLDTIVDRLTSLIEQHFGVAVIDVTTVVELDDALRQSIRDKYTAQLGTPVAIREHIDPGIKGGIIMELGGRRIDASLNTQLVRARAVLASDTVGGMN